MKMSLTVPSSSSSLSHLSRSKGATRNLSQLYLRLKHKEAPLDPRDRFKPLKSTFLNENTGTYSGLSSPNDTGG